MTYRVIKTAIITFTLLALIAGACAAEERLKQISEDGINVMYPPMMDVQAKKVLEIAKKSLAPSLNVQKQIATLLANPDPVSKDIGALLGAEEIQDDAHDRLKAYGDKSKALVQCFSNIRLVKKSEAVSEKGLDAGVLHVQYLKDKDEFKMTLDTSDTSDNKLKASFFPVFINADGSIRAENKLVEMAQQFMGSGNVLVVAPIHETIDYLISEKLKIYHPFTRWFNEGVSGWVARRVITKNYPKQANTINGLLSVSPKSKENRDKINLLAWPQPAYQNKAASYYDSALETAHTQYAVEAISDLLAKNGESILPKIMSELNYTGNPNTDKICEAITKATSKDFKSTLLTYVPQDIKAGINADAAKKLSTDAEALVQDKKWADAVAKLRQALQINPNDVNARLNLAWIEREVGERLDSEMQVFTSAALLKKDKYSFHMFAGSIEGNYVMGRLAILLGDLDSAKKFLKPVLELKPDHADAKRAMNEIKQIEGAVGAAGS